MKVYSNFPHELPTQAAYPVVALGVFDGVHIGHQKILATALEKAHGQPVAVVTFDPHPRAVLGPPKRARLLSAMVFLPVVLVSFIIASILLSAGLLMLCLPRLAQSC